MTETRTRPNGRHLTSCRTEGNHADGLSIEVLGPMRVLLDGREVALPSRRQRALLVLFAVNANVVVSAGRLAEELWDGAPPPGALVTLRSYISHLRKALGDGATRRSAIVTTDLGYRLEIDPARVDVVRFRSAVATGHRLMREGEPGAALDAFDAAERLWRGEPLAELFDHSATAAIITELTDLHVGATEERARALVATGRHVEAVPVLEQLVAGDPLRETGQELLMLALYRGGRSGDALEAYRRFREGLRDELGIDPGPRLDQLMDAILYRDPRLDLVAPEPSSSLVPAPDDASQAELIRTLTETVRALGEQVAALTATIGVQTAPGRVEVIPVYGRGGSATPVDGAIAS